MEEPAVAKAWYKKWWGVLILLGTWPFVLAWYAWKHSDWGKIAKTVATAPAALALIVGIAGSQANTSNVARPADSPKPKQVTTAVEQVATPTPTPTPTATPVPTPTPVKTTPKAVAAATPAPANSNCDPNYSGCVPIASDVDCAGGGGNGPAYVKGPIKVIGKDIYGLDSDHDGIACE